MQFKKFLQVGVVSLVAASSLANAIAQPVNAMLEAPLLNNSEIVHILKENISKDDLTYIVKNARSEKNDRTESIYNKINNLITSQYGSKHLDSVKNELNDTLKQLGPSGEDIKINYSYATPKQIIDEVASTTPDITTNDTSRADNAADVSKECEIQINLAVDNNGRLFESSELASLSQEQVSKMSNHELMSVMKETVLHEVSHCILHNQMKDKDFSLKFSDTYAKQNPTIVKILNEKINGVKTKFATEQTDNINVLDYMTFMNFHENFADINGAFARLGKEPNADSIKETKEHILNLARFRESSDLKHQTHYAIQYALTKIDEAAKMPMEQRTEFAKEIASDSLMNNMRLVLRKGLGNNDIETFGSYMVDGLKIASDGAVNFDVKFDRLADYANIQDEIIAMKEAGHTMGTMSQRLVSYKALMEEHGNEIFKVAENHKPNNMPDSQKTYAFNLNAYMSIRERSLGQDSYLESKKRLKS